MTKCNCPVYEGMGMHFDDCPVLQAAILKHREAVESMIREHTARAGLTRNGKISVDELKARCQLKQFPALGKLELWIDGKCVAEMQDMVRLVP